MPGLEAVERYDKLMILGKPGAGKTTFMKRLATLCNHGEFQAHRLPVFVTLKEFAEATGKPGLEAYIRQQWAVCGIEDAEALAQILGQGRALILLDGLDEVQETDHDRILQDIKDFTGQYRDCQFVMTCRIAAREYTFQHFTEVEVADFNEAQIAEFATKWFKVKQDPEKGETFIQRLKDNRPIQELATNPLLLTLLCLVFGEANDFPVNRSELYKEGLDVLLKKWDAKRNIERDQIYKKLSLKRKEDLLSQLAFATFEKGDYFFKQSVVEQHILDYIRNLPGAQEDEEALQLDSEAVLKSIEAQHGLLVERACGIYSFSHLTFQEYFTAKQITRPTTQLPLALANLAQHITEKRYREIFLLTVDILPEADYFLILFKQKVDLLLSSEPCLQGFMSWVHEKSKSTVSRYNVAAVRAFYLYLARSHGRDSYYDFPSPLDFPSLLFSRFSLDLLHAIDRNLFLDFQQSAAYDHDYLRDPCRYQSSVKNFDCELGLDINLIHVLDSVREPLSRTIHLDRALFKVQRVAIKFAAKIKNMKLKIPNLGDCQAIIDWYFTQEKEWNSEFRSLTLQHRNIGHEWEFTDAQEAKLQQYHNANKLLVDCLNSDCYVTQATRQYIEDTLLLPMSEIEKYPVPGQH